MVFIAYPIAWVVTNSTFDGESVALGNFVGLQHYLTVITDPVFGL